MIYQILAPLFVAGLFVMIIAVAFQNFFAMMEWLVARLGGE